MFVLITTRMILPNNWRKRAQKVLISIMKTWAVKYLMRCYRYLIHLRIPVCGLVSSYNATELPPGPDRLPLLMATVLKKRIRLQGFIIAQDYGHRIHEFQREMGQWVKEDKIHYREEITDGLENAPQTFIGLLKGKNFGKVVIRVAGDD